MNNQEFFEHGLLFQVMMKDGIFGQEYKIEFALSDQMVADAFQPFPAYVNSADYVSFMREVDKRARAIELLARNFAQALSKHMETRDKK